MLDNGISLTWLGHATFKMEYEGKVVLVDPWVANNPSCPEQLKTFERIDIMLITHGHFDHIADAPPLAKAHKPQVVGIFETCEWLGKKGVENLHGMNKGGTLPMDGFQITMVHADHSCGIMEDDGSIVYGGEAVGFVITFPNGYKIYHAGDTNVFSDMALIAELYSPDLALLPVGDRFTMGPREAKKAVEFLNTPNVVPMHFGTFPLLTGTPQAFRELVGGMNVNIIELQPGETLT